VQHQPVKVTPVFILPEIISAVIIVFATVKISRSSSFVPVYRTRAPPASV